MVRGMCRWVCALAASGVVIAGCGGGHGSAPDGGGGGGAGGAGAGGGNGGNDGGGAPPASCGQVRPCGGDVVGTWAFLGVCEDTAAISAELAAGCPGASVSDYAQTISGFLTLNADLTYVSNVVRETLSSVHTTPLNCTSALDCPSQSRSIPSGNDTSTTTCTGTTTCICRDDFIVSNAVINGTYSIQGNSLTLATSQSSVTSSYCVDGDLLHQIGLGLLTGPTGQPSILSDVVSQRR